LKLDTAVIVIIRALIVLYLYDYFVNLLKIEGMNFAVSFFNRNCFKKIIAFQ